MKRPLFVIVTAFLVACTTVPKETGALEGHVTIGPLLPAMREGLVEPTPAPEAYAVRQILIYAQDGRTEIARAQIDASGDYRVTLPVGAYVVDINHAGMDQGIDLPTTVEIVSQRVTRLDIKIDTGVR